MELYLCAGLATDVIRLIASIVVFAFVIAATYFTTRFIGNFQKKSLKGTNFDTIEVYRLNANKYLQLIRVGNQYIVIAVCKDTVTTICKLDAEELVTVQEEDGKQQLNLSIEPQSFSDMFESFRQKNKDKDIEENEEQNEDAG